jgi:indole-3-glycerol phosphate synthase
MTVLEEIIAYKNGEVTERKELVPVRLLEKSIHFEVPTVSLKAYLQREDRQGIIAEIKRKSPSNPEINPNVNVEKTSIGYMQAGASALSILTDSHFFGGSNEDLETARRFNFCPILRKDFIVDEYQVIEAKSIGADAILLIAAALTPREIKTLSDLARKLGLEVLIEFHDEHELKQDILDCASVVGINNRNLKTMKVSLEQSEHMRSFIPDGCVSISESGIKSPDDVIKLKAMGYDGFLIGELFMRSTRPGRSCMKFIDELQKTEVQS